MTAPEAIFPFRSFSQLPLLNLPPVVDTAAALKSRHLVLGGRLVSFSLRSGRRRLSMTIDERGLSVGSPRGMSMTDIEAFIRSHTAWVIEKLDEYAARAVARQAAIRHGTRLPLLGGEIEVHVQAGSNRSHWPDDGTLILAARPQADLDALARRALQGRALSHFVSRATELAVGLDQKLPPITLSSARTRWGSCSRISGIRLNWRLIHLPPHVVDYVVAHELAHLREMNHSPRFWAEVERVYPEWHAARADLKQLGRDVPLV